MKKHIIIVVFLLLNLTAFAQVNKLLRQANRATDLNEKVALYSQVIALEPRNLDAHFYRGLAKNDLGDFSGAIVDYSKIIVIQPDADTYYNRANSRYNSQDYLGAKEDYESAYKLDPNFIAALYSLGSVKFDLAEYEEAIKDFSTIIKLIPTDSRTYFLRAASYNALEKYTLALNDYTLAILADPSSDSYYKRGVFFLGINYYDKANFDFSMAVKLNENNAFAYFYRGTTSLLLGKYNDAIIDFNNALRFDAFDFDALVGLALTYQKMNDLNNAKLNFERAKTIILPEGQAESIEDFKNTYWFQNQYLYFNDNFKNIVNL